MTICYHCSGEFRWVFKEGKFQPLNRSDDKPHWLTCKGFKKAKRSKDVASKSRPMELASPAITGADYRTSCGCDVPPWETCACSELCV